MVQAFKGACWADRQGIRDGLAAAHNCTPLDFIMRAVDMPANADEAEMMEKLGFAYLKQHAPERLTDEGGARAEAERLVPYRDELLKIAEDVGEGEDPFSAWEAVAALKHDNERMSKALAKIAIKAEAGLCAGSFGGARAFHEDIHSIATEARGE
jgi:hypothetical protein